MTDKEKAKELASLLVGEDQYQEPLVEILMEMANWQKEQMIDKVCEWLEDNVFSSEQLDRNYSRKFRKAMEAEK